MSGSKDKGLTDLLIVNKALLAEQKASRDKVLLAGQKVVLPNPANILSGLLVRESLKMLAPRLLNNLDKIGLGPGRLLK